jgi:hypothetical protein
MGVFTTAPVGSACGLGGRRLREKKTPPLADVGATKLLDSGGHDVGRKLSGTSPFPFLPPPTKVLSESNDWSREHNSEGSGPIKYLRAVLARGLFSQG